MARGRSTHIMSVTNWIRTSWAAMNNSLFEKGGRECRARGRVLLKVPDHANCQREHAPYVYTELVHVGILHDFGKYVRREGLLAIRIDQVNTYGWKP